MAKVDLIQNEDFIAYQKDLEKRLDEAIKTMHHILIQPASSWEDAQLRILKLEGVRAVIAELELVIGMPITYLPKENEEAAVKAKKTLGNRFIKLFRQVFSDEGGNIEA